MALPDKIRDTWELLAERMIEDMSRDDLSWVREWSLAAPPQNAVTGVPYRGRNALLLMYALRIMGLKDPRFMTFNAAKEAGWAVRKGEKSFAVIEKWKTFAVLISDPAKRIEQPRTKEEWDELLKDDDVTTIRRCVGYYNLFHASQVDGIDPFEMPERPALDDYALDVLEDASPCPVTEAYQDRAFYAPLSDSITMPLREQFSSTGGFARTLLHEMGHATGADSRLARGMKGRFGSEPYAQEELVAELTALFTSNALGFDAGAVEVGPIAETDYWANHAAYLKSWASDLENPGEALRAAAGKATSASSLILEPFMEVGIDRWREPGVYRFKSAAPLADPERDRLRSASVIAASSVPSALANSVEVEALRPGAFRR